MGDPVLDDAMNERGLLEVARSIADAIAGAEAWKPILCICLIAHRGIGLHGAPWHIPHDRMCPTHLFIEQFATKAGILSEVERAHEFANWADVVANNKSAPFELVMTARAITGQKATL